MSIIRTIQQAVDPGRAARTSVTKRMQFFKYQALGNDYIVLDRDAIAVSVTPELAESLCDRHFGIGSDGVLLIASAGDGTFQLRIFNPDGSEAEKSGNGLRIAAKYLIDSGKTSSRSFVIQTAGGDAPIQILKDAFGEDRIKVGMGQVSFSSERIPMAGPSREVVSAEMEVLGEKVIVTCANVGNPHCVIFAPSVDAEMLRRLGPAIERHPSFPNGINVQTASVVDSSTIEALIWERGAGETLASGSSASAVVAAAVRNHLTEKAVRVHMPGGTLDVEIADDWTISLAGPARMVFAGDWEDGHGKGETSA